MPGYKLFDGVHLPKLECDVLHVPHALITRLRYCKINPRRTRQYIVMVDVDDGDMCGLVLFFTPGKQTINAIHEEAFEFNYIDNSAITICYMKFLNTAAITTSHIMFRHEEALKRMIAVEGSIYLKPYYLRDDKGVIEGLYLPWPANMKEEYGKQS